MGRKRATDRRRYLAALLAIALAASCATTEHASLPRVERPAAQQFDRALVDRGAMLAAMGNCRGCHTAPDGRSFAGGLPIETPFGAVHSTNITPDPETGIGAWSEAAFGRAMREGVDRGGHHLYPAFPYDHFTLVTDADNQALYAYLMTRGAVRYRPPENHLVFPFNIRAGIAIWKRLYFVPGPYKPDASKSAVWNRGAYLSEGLGHCGACHTPRNKLGAERKDREYDGGEAEGWHAYAINENSAAAIPWAEDSLAGYLRRGWHEGHGIARGPMAAVTSDLAQVSETEVRAIAAYLASRMGTRPVAPPRRPIVAADAGMALYQRACHGCHDGRQPLPFGGMPLAFSIGVTGESPRNLLIVTLRGLPAAEGETTPLMPGFAGALSERQLVELVASLRANFTDKPPWDDLEKVAREVIAAGPRLGHHPPGGHGVDPASRPERIGK